MHNGFQIFAGVVCAHSASLHDPFGSTRPVSLEESFASTVGL